MAKTDEYIPRTLKECYAEDRVSNSLWYWSDRIVTWGQRLLVIMIIIGIITTISSAVQVSKIDDDQVFMSIVTSVISWSLYIFIAYCSYRILSLLIEALASIVQNTKTTAMINLYNAAKEDGVIREDATGAPAAARPDTSFSLSGFINSKSDSSGFWECPDCETKNNKGSAYCKVCGRHI